MEVSEFRAILEQVERGVPAVLVREAEGKVYRRRFCPEERLILLGGGHIAKVLCTMGALLDYSVTVVDDRPAYAQPSRFPEADRVICDSFVDAIEGLKLRENDYVCVITRGHRWDGDCLRKILSGTMPYYLGMIGSSRRVAALLDLLGSEGFDVQALSRIHAPIGLRIGALTPAEIAVSICGELVQCRRQRPGEEAEVDLMPQENTDLSMLRFLAAGEGPRAMCLVLSTQGSTPVKAGAMMAVDRLGRGYGTVGGGCGEAEVMTAARRIIGTGGSRVVEVSMDEDVSALEGMACGGTMRVLVEDVALGVGGKRDDTISL
ncbi:MAG: XdhC family protein [Oscillospiraceae bacterium]|nr:XdhC family protein [Oscillospiraceae bacterium]